MLLHAQNEVCFEIESNPNLNDPAFQCFSKYINVLGCFEVYAQQNISDEKVLHVAAIAAELLDNNEDGVVDDEMLFIAELIDKIVLSETASSFAEWNSND